MDDIGKIFGIKNGDVVSIIGAGGKTSLLYTLGDFFDNSLITTTTKLFAPDDRDFIVGKIPSKVDGSLIAVKSQKENKLYGFTASEIRPYFASYDHTFIEADGARMMNLKAWKQNEPVICDFSNKSIGVLDIKTVGGSTKETVFRLDEYKKITTVSDVVHLENLRDIVLHPNGMFKFSNFKILYINKVELKEDLENAYKLVTLLLEDSRFNIDRIVIGSIHNQSFEVVYKAKGVFVLASGLSKRMGQDKLSMMYRGRPLIDHVLNKLSNIPEDVFLVTKDDRFNELACKYGIEVLLNSNYKDGQSSSIKKSLEQEYHYYTYFLGDMPHLSKETIFKIIKDRSELLACGSSNLFSAPATLSYKYKEELLQLSGDQGAKKVLKKHIDKIKYINVSKQELFDIDTKDDLEVS